MATIKKSRYGWVPDLPDRRDHMYALRNLGQQLPAKVDLHMHCPPVYDQGDLGSCTANALAAALDFERKRQEMPFMNPSRLFIYYNERVIEDSVAQDNGAQLRDGMKAVATQGACAETLWPYVIDEFTVKPPAACYADGAQHTALQYSRLPQDLTHLKTCLATGYPFVFGFTVYESFESDVVAQTGKATMPSRDEQSLGGHAVLAVGYSDASQRFLVRNSWGAKWGVNGYFTLPYAYVTDPNLADDFWTIRLVH